MAGFVRAGALVAALAVSAGSAGCSSTTAPVAETPLPRVSATPTPAASGTAPTPTPSPAKVRAQAVSKASLVPFASCDDLLSRVKREALTQVTPYGLPGDGYLVRDAVALRTAAPAAAPGAAAEASTPDHSTTNNQEAGVDEADLVKTDGRLMVVMRQEKPGVQVVDVRGTPRLRGFFPLPQGMYGGELLLVGGRAVVVGTRSEQDSRSYRAWTHVLVLSLADPDVPRVEREFEVEGRTATVREVGGRVLLVTRTGADIEWAYPADGTRAAEQRALRENKRRINRSGLGAWLPSVRSVNTGRTYRPGCEDGLRAQSPSGTATTTLLSLDPASDVPGAQAMVEGSSAVVYASTRSVYVTTWSWAAQRASKAWTEPTTTSIHRFDVSDPSHPMYAASGEVPGTLIGQYAMSEHEGHLRVASTLGRTWAMQADEVPPSDNLVTVLEQDDEQLVEVGQVKGLGRGERIYGVRFLGPLAYVVTFRETDPLYAIDLSDPARPTVRGELKVTGYSSYLHPIDDGLLLGIGQEVKENRRMGTQVSTFDVSDSDKPTLRDRELVGQGWSGAEHDPHAVLWWATSRDLVVPYTSNEADRFDGAVVLHVGARGGLTEVGRIEHPEVASQPDPDHPGVMRVMAYGGILRSVVVGELLLTVSERGVLASDFDSLEDAAWLPYR